MKLTLPILILLILNSLLLGQIPRRSLSKADEEALEQYQKLLFEQKESYSKLDNVLASEAFQGETEIFEGLPHQDWNKDLLETELKKNTSFKSHNFPFYTKKSQSSNADDKSLKLILQSKKCYRKYSGPKLCGGYHPDFMIRFKGKTETVTVHLCFGCHEARIFTKDSTVYCDLTSNSYTLLYAILEDGFRFRPDKKRHVTKLIKYLKETNISDKLLSKKTAKKWRFGIYQVVKDGLVEVQFTDYTSTEKVLFLWNPKRSQWIISNRKTNGIVKPDLPKKAADLRIPIELNL